MVKFAVGFGAPIAIRYPRGEAYDGLKEYRAPIAYGKGEYIYEEEDICLIAVGSMVKVAEQVRKQLKDKGYSCSLINARFVKPIDEELIAKVRGTHKLLVTMEENVASGGFGEKVREFLGRKEMSGALLTVTIPDEYVEHGNVDLLKQEIGIDADSVVKKVITEYGTLK